jgi:citrate lyase gamma subunit
MFVLSRPHLVWPNETDAVTLEFEQRVKRQHGKSFDRLLRRAKKQLAGVAVPA